MKKDQYWTVIVPVVYRSFTKRASTLPVQWPMLERYNIVPIPVFTAPIPVLFTGIGAVSLRSLLSRSVTGPLPFRSFRTDTVPVLYRSVPFRYRSIVPSSKNRRSLQWSSARLVIKSSWNHAPPGAGLYFFSFLFLSQSTSLCGVSSSRSLKKFLRHF